MGSLFLIYINGFEMLNNLFKVIIIFIFLNSVALCKELDTDQQKIDSAIEIIKKYGYEKNIAILQGNNYTHKPVSIIFKDLSELDFTYAKHYALSATDNKGDLYILVNNNLRNSDVRVIACLLLHESFHNQYNNPDSVTEEATAHMAELTLYNTILINEEENLQYKVDDRLVARENKLREMVLNSMKAYVTSNTAYVNYLKLKE